MHSYTSLKNGEWTVYFDSGNSEGILTLRVFDNEGEAAMFAHYMNGGEVDRLCLRRWFLGAKP